MMNDDSVFHLRLSGCIGGFIFFALPAVAQQPDKGLLAHWPLATDAKDTLTDQDSNSLKRRPPGDSEVRRNRGTSQRQPTNGCTFVPPPSADHAPRQNRNCQQNGLKNQLPSGYALRFQPK